MGTYLFIMLLFMFQIPIFANLKHEKIKKINCNYIIVFDCFILVLIAMYRNIEVGTDLKTYIYWFNELKEYNLLQIFEWSKASSIEVGYGLIAKISLLIFQKNEFVLMVFNVIIFVFVSRFLLKYSPNYAFSMYLFITFSFYNQSFNVNRQVVAASILLESIKYIKERKFKDFLLIVFIASLIHFSSIFFIVVYFLAQIGVEKSRSICIIIVATAFFVSKSYGLIQMIVSKTTYSSYLTKELNSERGVGIYINLLIFLICIVWWKRIIQIENNNIWIYCLTLTLSLNFMISSIGMIARLMIYFKLFYIVSIPSILSFITDKKIRLCANIFVVLLFGVYYYHSISGSCFQTVPYVSDHLGIGV